MAIGQSRNPPQNVQRKEGDPSRLSRVIRFLAIFMRRKKCDGSIAISKKTAHIRRAVWILFA
jgi:hypothetical protein